MRNRLPITLLPRIFAALTLLHSVAGAFSADADSFVTVIAPAMQKHCAKCHGANADELEGDLNLLKLKSGDLDDNPELIRSLIDVLDL